MEGGTTETEMGGRFAKEGGAPTPALPGSGEGSRAETGREGPGCTGRQPELQGGGRGTGRRRGATGQGCVELLALLRKRCLHAGGLGTLGLGVKLFHAEGPL